jgi:hypothetical protein
MKIEQFVNEASFRHVVTQGRETQLAELLGEFMQGFDQPLAPALTNEHREAIARLRGNELVDVEPLKHYTLTEGEAQDVRAKGGNPDEHVWRSDDVVVKVGDGVPREELNRDGSVRVAVDPVVVVPIPLVGSTPNPAPNYPVVSGVSALVDPVTGIVLSQNPPYEPLTPAVVNPAQTFPSAFAPVPLTVPASPVVIPVNPERVVI